jgi:sulfite exporter TauE/SafE
MLDTIMPGTAPLPETIGMFSVWLLGVSMGLTACTVTCLPFMGTWVLGRGGSNRETLTDTGIFLLGRVTAYSLLGGLAGALGMWLTQALSSGIGNAFIGAASIGAGIWLFLPARRKSPCSAARQGASTPPFLLGFSLSLTPCAPLASLLAICAISGGTLSGAGYGLMFGLGAALTPLLLLLPLLNLFGARMRDSQPWLAQWIRLGAGLVLMLIGIRRLWLI